MDKIISLNGKNIQITFTQHKVNLPMMRSWRHCLQIIQKHQLMHLLRPLNRNFRNVHNKEIDISDASMAVEIWGHVYTENFAAAVKSLSSLGFLDSIADKIIDKCEVIDMGESGRDNNRFVWDTLAKFKSKIAALPS